MSFKLSDVGTCGEFLPVNLLAILHLSDSLLVALMVLSSMKKARALWVVNLYLDVVVVVVVVLVLNVVHDMVHVLVLVVYRIWAHGLCRVDRVMGHGVHVHHRGGCGPGDA